MRIPLILLSLVCLFAPVAWPGAAAGRQVSLAGEWRFRLDPQDEGIAAQWYLSDLPERIPLPGSTDEHRRGARNDKIEARRLTRSWEFVGAAWYQRDVEIPAEWAEKRVLVYLERCHWESQLWLDGKAIGLQNSLSTPQVHELGLQLKPGKHRITLRVDNRMKINVGPWASGITEEGPGNWNGVTGRIELQMTDPIWIEAVRVFPNVPAKAARVLVKIRNLTGKAARGELLLTPSVSGASTRLEQTRKPVEISPKPETSLEVQLPLGPAPQLWDEFSPALYDLVVQLGESEARTQFGLRDWNRKGTQFALNGRPLVLRGNVDNGSFPLQGYPPMDVNAWKRRLQIYLDYGFNHVRFHSWCPPEAAFTAADQLGMLLQVENPMWIGDGRISSDSARTAFIRSEAERIVDTYGNHPSFVLMSMGNELGSGLDPFLRELVEHLQRRDPRHYYTSTTAPDSILRPDDYFVSAGPRWQNLRGDPRFEQTAPNTDFDYREYLAGLDRPTIAHELGQWTVYPDLDEGRKYTGSQQPRYLETYRQSAVRNHIADQIPAFRQASGRHMVALYKEEIESVLRTPGMAGFQLLALEDWPGFGPAFIGALDTLLDSRDLITPAAYRRFCANTVVLLRMSKREWRRGETFSAEASLARYGPGPHGSAGAKWAVRTSAGQTVASGDLPPTADAASGLRTLGNIRIPLAGLEAPAQYSIEVAAGGTANDWDVWVYPDTLAAPASADVFLVKAWNEEARSALRNGRRVVLLAQADTLEHVVPVSFTTSFWSLSWFPKRPETMGILCDPRHPALAEFPTGSHSGWQWWHLMSRGHALILDNAPAAYRPLVQVIDDPTRNHKLGAVFEARVGNGKLLVTVFDLESSLESRLAARQLRHSLLRYAGSAKFDPQQPLDPEFLDRLLAVKAATARPWLHLQKDAARWTAASITSFQERN